MSNFGVEYSAPGENAWVSAEEHFLGAEWKKRIDAAIVDLNAVSLDVPDYEAVESLKQKGHKEDIIDYIRDTMGIGNAWWKFCLMEPAHHVLFATMKGFIKMTDLDHFRKIQSNGKIAIELRDDDTLLDIVHARKNQINGVDVSERTKELEGYLNKGWISENTLEGHNRFVEEWGLYAILVTAKGILAKIPVDNMKSKGRNSRGLTGIKLKDGDSVVSFNVVSQEDDILLITEQGYGKRVKVNDFRIMKRGAVGVKCLNTDQKSGDVVSALCIDDEAESAIFATDGGQVIRIKPGGIPVYKRQARGVILVKLKEGQKIISGEIKKKEYD